jgi:hypothetical protein
VVVGLQDDRIMEHDYDDYPDFVTLVKVEPRGILLMELQ